MITGISIENFKGIRERVEIELRPLTLLFGANSAGKSSILQALHYAAEIFDRHNLNADFTSAGGKSIDLGGFRNCVHGRDVSRSIIFRFDLNIAGTRLFPDCDVFDRMSAYTGLLVDDLMIALRRAAIEIELAFSEFHQAVSVRRYAVILDAVEFAVIAHNPDQRSVLAKLNLAHPRLLRPRHMAAVDATPEEIENLKEMHADIDQSALETCMEYVREFLPFTGGAPLLMEDALPDFDAILPLAHDRPTSRLSDDWLTQEGMLDEIKAGLTQLIVGPGRLLRDWLRAFVYLGPIRELPARGYAPPRTPDPTRWASGIAAWDLLATGSEDLVDKVSDWLSQPDRLNTRYRVERRRYKRLDLADPLIRSLASGRAFDEADRTHVDLSKLPTETQVVLVSTDSNLDLLAPDVGIGISQVLPVVVAALDDDERLVIVEQPELHVHPKIQAELGDLFIETAVDGGHSYVIETHSEHLILRLLRRIRETNQGKPHNGIAITDGDVGVYYVSMNDGCTRLRRIDIDKKGEFIQPWPDDFFEIDFYERFA